MEVPWDNRHQSQLLTAMATRSQIGPRSQYVSERIYLDVSQGNDE